MRNINQSCNTVSMGMVLLLKNVCKKRVTGLNTPEGLLWKSLLTRKNRDFMIHIVSIGRQTTLCLHSDLNLGHIRMSAWTITNSFCDDLTLFCVRTRAFYFSMWITQK